MFDPKTATEREKEKEINKRERRINKVIDGCYAMIEDQEQFFNRWHLSKRQIAMFQRLQSAISEVLKEEA